MLPVNKIKEEKMDVGDELPTSSGGDLIEGIEITRWNLTSGISEILELISKADFVALDATVETSGYLTKTEELNRSLLKDPQDCYGQWWEEIKSAETKHCLLEVGLAIFNWNPELPDQFQVEVFNIPVLPAYFEDGEDESEEVPIFVNDTGMEFIQSVGFNVERSVEHGAPYLNRDLCRKASNYIRSSGFNSKFMLRGKKRFIPSLIPHLRQRITESNGMQLVEVLMGVSRIFEGITSAGMPVIGHDLFLKMIFIYKDFFEYLPESYPEYLDKMREACKLIYDTKRMAKEIQGLSELSGEHRLRLTQLQLYPLFRNLCNYGGGGQEESETFAVVIGDRAELYQNDLLNLTCGEAIERNKSSHCYEAGFDALISALVFLDLISILQLNKINCRADEQSGSASLSTYRQYYDMFMKGEPSSFKNTLYGEPALAERRPVQELPLPFNECPEWEPEPSSSVDEGRGISVSSSSSDISFTTAQSSDVPLQMDIDQPPLPSSSSSSITSLKIQENPIIPFDMEPENEPEEEVQREPEEVLEQGLEAELEKGLEEVEWEVEQILGKRVHKKIIQYWIKWKDWPDCCNTWEPEENIQGCPDLLIQFNKKWSERKRTARAETKAGKNGVPAQVKWEVEQILGKRLRKGIVQYWIKWEDWPDCCNTWEPEDRIQGCPDLLNQFNKEWNEKKPKKAGPGRGYTKAVLLGLGKDGIVRKRARYVGSDNSDEEETNEYSVPPPKVPKSKELLERLNRNRVRHKSSLYKYEMELESD